MNNNDKGGNSDAEMINIHENYSVEHWATVLNVSPNSLREIIEKTGTNVAQVKAYLNNK
jgi:AraC-like DNA-binding protein